MINVRTAHESTFLNTVSSPSDIHLPTISLDGEFRTPADYLERDTVDERRSSQDRDLDLEGEGFEGRRSSEERRNSSSEEQEFEMLRRTSSSSPES
jgi:hypothetical protein